MESGGVEPTIKGIFVNSHLKALKEKKGEDGIKKLEDLYKKPLEFKNDDNVPVREEVKIIEYALDVLLPDMDPEKRAYEAGRLHFNDFISTPFAKIIFKTFARNFKLMMLQTKNIAGHVFRGVRFSSEDLADKSVRVIMENNDYPLDHFRGLFQAWMEFSGLTGKVEAQKEGEKYIYTMKWS